MTFVVTLALGIGLLVVLPLVAHWLRRGHAQLTPFAPTRLVPTEEHVARRRHRVTDKPLLAIRATIILLLALLGATPLVRCERATLTRHAGASMAVMIVLDDSGSMRHRIDSGDSRLVRAKRAAAELVDQMRDGDSFGLVLAGKPARLLLLPAANPGQVRQLLGNVVESDRPTDLVTAIGMAESALDRQPQIDKRVVLLSDLSAELPLLSPRVTVLEPELAVPTQDCGILSAIRGYGPNRGQISVEVACSKATANAERRLEFVSLAERNRVLAGHSIALHAGRETYSFEDSGGSEPVQVILRSQDDNPSDDAVPLIQGGVGRTIATYSDPATGRGTTGGPPLIEQALHSIDANLVITPLTTVPEQAEDLTTASLLLLDDPPSLSAEARSAILAFVERGGTAVAFFGPLANAAQLGSLLLPFIERRATWENTAPRGLDPSSLSTLGVAGKSLVDIDPKGRLLFDESHDPKVVIHARWSDQRPFWIERPIGRGLVMALGLPTSIERSDLGLRSGFLAILSAILGTSERLGVATIVTVGTGWRFARGTSVQVTGPRGLVGTEDSQQPSQSDTLVFPNEVGRYQVKLGAEIQQRFAILPAEEILEPPRTVALAAASKPDRATGRLDLSRWLVEALVAFLAIELALGSGFLREFFRTSLMDGWRRLGSVTGRVERRGPRDSRAQRQ